MAIVYKKVVRLSDPTKKDSVKKAYPSVTYRYNHPATLEEFARDLSESSGLSEGDIFSVLKNFRKLLKKTLTGGRLVNIKGLGVFFISLQSQGVENPEEFTSAHIEGLRICFRAHKDIRLNAGATTRTEGLVFRDASRIDKDDETPVPDKDDETPKPDDETPTPDDKTPDPDEDEDPIVDPSI